MFSKTRKKIIVAIMTFLIVFLAVTLATIYGTSYYSLKKENKEMLDRYITLYSLDAPPFDGPPGLPPDIEEIDQLPPEVTVFRLSSFYSVAVSEEGEILSIDIDENGIYSENEIVTIAFDLLKKNRASGVTKKLMYQIEERDGYTLIAFIDTTVTESNMDRILVNTLIAGVIAVAVLFFAAVFLARIIVRPLEENDRKQKQFVSDAEHELKTPVSIVSTNVELLSRQIGENEWLSNIRYENERMSNLIKDLLDLSRAENSSFTPEIVDLSRLTEREVLPFEGIAYEHGLIITTRIMENITVKGNQNQLGQLISILTDNAVSHGSGGKEIQVELERDHRQAVLKVINEGEEIPENIREHLFDRFFRLDEARVETGGHYGLGLSIAKAIVTAHKGNIDVECPEGYIVFKVFLPLEK